MTTVKSKQLFDSQNSLPGHVAQSVTCLAIDVSLTADPGGHEFDHGPVPYFRGD